MSLAKFSSRQMTPNKAESIEFTHEKVKEKMMHLLT
jgi:hypothetical protein